MAVYLVATALSAVPLVVDRRPETIAWLAAGQVGASPSERRRLFVAPHVARGSVAPNELSPYRTNTSDVVYVDARLARLATAKGVPDHLGSGALCLLSPTWGVCHDTLYLGPLPRRCRQGAEGKKWCPVVGGCGVSFENTQHVGECVAGVATFAFGDLTVSARCETVIEANKAVAAVVPGPPRLSLHRAELAFEYTCDDSVLALWAPPAAQSDVGPLVTMAGLVVFLSVWQAWTAQAAGAMAVGDAAAIAGVWSTMGWFALVVGDALWFAAASKVYHLITVSDSIAPAAIDELVGHRAALSYSWLYVGTALLLALVGWALLALIALATSQRAAPRWATNWFGAALATTGTLSTQCVVLTTLQWIVDVVVLTALHVASPPSLGATFRDALGLAIGITVAVVTGRSAVLLAPYTAALEARVLGTVGFLAALGHVTVFMVYPLYATAEGSPYPALAMAATTAVQSAAAGAVWTKLTTGRAPPRRRTAEKASAHRAGL